MTATLVINLTSSRCGHCRRPVLPSATHHRDIAGYDFQEGGGCGARFTATATDHPGRITAERLCEMRPDLPTDTDTRCAHPYDVSHRYAPGSEIQCPVCGAVNRLYACGPLAGHLPSHHDLRNGWGPGALCPASDRHPETA